ncbi:MAG: GNAT family N-acetyltransferase [Hyphomicrobiaceae bacterium]
MNQPLLRDRAFGDIAALPDTAGSERDSGIRYADSGRGTLDFELVTTLAGFEALEDGWNALYAEAAKSTQAFQAFNWCWHWCRHYLETRDGGLRLAIVAARKGGRLVLIMPFVVQRRAMLNELTWLGEPVSQYGDVLASREAAGLEALEAAWQFAVTQTGADVANLRRVRSDAVVKPLLDRIGATITATEEAPFLALGADQTFEGWEARRQPRARKNRRRQARRLADLGETAFVSLSGSEEAAALAAHAIRLKRDLLPDKGSISPALSDARFEAFFADAAHGRGRPAGVTVLAITCGGAPAALKVLIETKDAAFLHIAVFEPRFERCGAGALLLEHAVARTIEEGRGVLDLLPPRHAYKLDFADDCEVVHDFAMALSTKGWLYLQAYLRLRRRLKAMIEALPLPIRRGLARLASVRPASQP